MLNFILHRMYGSIYRYITYWCNMCAYLLITGWTVQDQIPVGTIFSARPDRPWSPPSHLYNGYRVFPGVEVARAWS